MRIAFVCTGNTCRSPMAEYIMREKLKKNGLIDYSVCSCGVYAVNGAGIHPYAENALKKLGINVEKHIATQISSDIINSCDLIIALSNSHLTYLGNSPKIKTLDSLTGSGDIADPYGGTQEEYISCARRIDTALDKLITFLLNIE